MLFGNFVIGMYMFVCACPEWAGEYSRLELNIGVTLILPWMVVSRKSMQVVEYL